MNDSTTDDTSLGVEMAFTIALLVMVVVAVVLLADLIGAINVFG
jgi:hypothetical protein